MSRAAPPPDVSYAGIWRAAWPIMLANAAVPLLGLADTAVLGRLGRVEELGALALGAIIFNFIYWTFGFLRMGTTGFVAQARGAGDEAEIHFAIGRSLLLGIGIGGVLIALQGPIADVALSLLSGSEAVEAVSRQYLEARIWGAPATLASFGVLGALIGLGHSRTLLLVQVFANGLNVALDVVLAGGLGWGARGVGLGTAISEWASVVLGGGLLLYHLGWHRPSRGGFARLLRVDALLRTLRAHADIMIRTLLLLFGFGWFVEQGARFGDATLAANHVALQLISFSAFFLDGYAFATESRVGAAAGARDRGLFDAVVRRSNHLALATALALCLGIWGFGRFAIALLTDLEAVRDIASARLPYVAGYVITAVWAFQLDGIFIDATRTADMRNCSLLSVLVFLAAGYPLVERLGNQGLWLAFILYAAARALSLAAAYPRLRRASFDLPGATELEPALRDVRE